MLFAKQKCQVLLHEISIQTDTAQYQLFCIPVLPMLYSEGANLPKCGGEGRPTYHMPIARFTHRFPLCSLYVQLYALYEKVKKEGSFLYFFCFSLLFFPFVRVPCFFSPSQFFFLSLFYLSIS